MLGSWGPDQRLLPQSSLGSEGGSREWKQVPYFEGKVSRLSWWVGHEVREKREGPKTAVVELLSRVRFSATPRTVAHEAPLSTGFPRQEYWSGAPFPSPGDLPHPGMDPVCPALQADSLLLSCPGAQRIFIYSVERTEAPFAHEEGGPRRDRFARKRPSLPSSTHQCTHSRFHPFSSSPVRFLSTNSRAHLPSFQNFSSTLPTIPRFTHPLTY